MVFLSKIVGKKLFLPPPAFLACLSPFYKAGSRQYHMTNYTLLLRLLPALINLLLQISTKYRLSFVCIWFKTTTTIKKTPTFFNALAVGNFSVTFPWKWSSGWGKRPLSLPQQMLQHLLQTQNPSCRYSSKSKSATALRLSVVDELLDPARCRAPKHPTKPPKGFEWMREKRMLNSSQHSDYLLFGPSVYIRTVKAHWDATSDRRNPLHAKVLLFRFLAVWNLGVKVWKQ